MEIIINGKKYENENLDMLAVELANYEGDDAYKIFEVLGKAHDLHFAQGCLDKKLTNKEKALICSLANQCYLKDNTDVGEIRFYDAIITLINNGHSLKKLEDMGTWELIDLCDEKGNLRCY